MSIIHVSEARWFFSVGNQEDIIININFADYSSAGQWLQVSFYSVDFGYAFLGELKEVEEMWS